MAKGMSTEKMRLDAARFRTSKERKLFWRYVVVTAIIAVTIAVMNITTH